MSVRHVPYSDAERHLCCSFSQRLRQDPSISNFVRHLRVTAIGDADNAWFAAMQDEGQLRASAELARLAAHDAREEMLRVARNFCARVTDAAGHRVSGALGYAMGGNLPSDLPRLRAEQQVYALRMLITFIRPRTDLSFDAGALADLERAVNTADAAILRAIAQRGAWSASVARKQSEAETFDAAWVALVGGLRSTGGNAQLRELLPRFPGRRVRVPDEVVAPLDEPEEGGDAVPAVDVSASDEEAAAVQ